MSVKNILVVVLFFLLNYGQVFGQGLNNLVQSNIDTVFVTYRNGESGFKSSYTVHKLSNPLQNNLNRTIPESLTEVPGLQVQRTNYGGGSPYLRGLTGNQILTVVDGIRLNNSTFRYGPNQYINTLDGLAISSLDLVLGTGSVQFGSDAMGGALSVNYRSANYSKEKKLALSKVGGSTRVSAPTGELSQRFFADFSSEKVALTAGLTFRKFGDVVVPGSDANKSVKLSPTGYSEINGDFNLRLKARNGEWTFAGNTVNQRNVPVYHKIALENFEKNTMDRQDRHLLYLRRTFIVNRATQVKFTAGLQNSYESRSMQKRNSDKLTQETDVVQTQFFLTELNHQLSRNWSLSSGYEFYRDKVLSSRYNTNTLTGNTLSSRGLYPDHSGLFQHSVFLMSKGAFSRYELTGGLRLQQTSSAMNIEPIGEILDRNLALVQTLGLSIDVSELNPIKGGELRVFSNYSSGFRAPNLDDLGTLGIVDFRYEVPQYDLRPEYSKNHEIGFKFRSKGVRAQISAYQNYLFDVIARTKSGDDSIQGYPVYQKENIERALFNGLEMMFEFSLRKNFSIKGGLAYTYGDNLSKGEPMRRVPPLNGMLQMNYLFGKNRNQTVFLRYTASGSQTRLASGDISDNRIGQNGTAGFVQFDLGYQILLNDYRIAVCMQNLSNEYVKIHGSGVPMAGRNLTLLFSF